MHSITRKHWLDGALADGPRLGYRGKATALAAMAAAAPLIVAARHASPAEMAALAAGAAAALWGLNYFLRPLDVLARNLRALSRGEPIEALDESAPDDARRMAADLARAKARIAGLEDSLPQVHAITGLPTREALLAAIREDARRAGQTAVLGVARMADYDRIAAFDDAEADQALRAFARRLQDLVLPGCLLAHVDRDCFALWFRGVDDPQAAAADMQRISAALVQPIGEGQHALTPDVRLSAAIFPDDAADPATLLSRAITALPRDGRSLSGAFAFYSAESSQSARQRFSLEQELRQAVARGQMVLHFQPVVDLARGAVVGAEALVRWNRPDHGLAPPGLFIPVLEETGLMDEVGLWVLTEACRQARAWQDAGLGGLRMAVNLSARQFRDPGLNALIVRTLEGQGLTPQQLELELTETAAMADVDRTRQMFGDLRDMGVGVAIDDFGAGYSSLSYLKNLPFTKLKIDREFVDRLNERRDSQAICHALIELARGLDITVVAEGVETEAELAVLRRLGCTNFQGFLFARPLPADAFARTITDPDWRRRLASPVHCDLADLRYRISA